MTQETTENKQENKKRRVVIILWICVGTLLCTNMVLLWWLLQLKSEVRTEKVIVKEITSERNNLQSDLELLKRDYEDLQASDEAMQLEIEAKKARIEELMREAAKHKNDAYIIKKLREETETLRAIMKGFVRTIDSLNTLNQTLVEEKKVLHKQLGAEKEKQNVLKQEKEELKTTIAKGSILTCFNITAKAVSFKRGGTKESETNKAKKAQKIKIGFTLGENKIAKAGEKTVYIRIVTPDGKEMATSYDEGNKFTFDKSSGYYAGKETLNYANTEISGVTYCEGQDPFVAGSYIVEITCDGVVIGSTTLKLD
ncbi:MAG: hypothetical protein KF900_07335 [Bacteroidetes bacterium]|nr:hypothetical protein [Bacteroidota bacterium]